MAGKVPKPDATAAAYIETDGRGVTLYFNNDAEARMFRDEWVKWADAEPEDRDYGG